MYFVPVFFEETDSKGNFVFDSLAFWIAGTPEFKILTAVIVAFSVLVMNCFVRMQGATEFFFHDFAMLKDLFAVATKTAIAVLINVAGALKIVCTFMVAKPSLVISFTPTFDDDSSTFIFFPAMFTNKSRRSSCQRSSVSLPVFPLKLSAARTGTKTWDVRVFTFKKSLSAMFATIFALFHGNVLTQSGGLCQFIPDCHER